MTSVSHECGQWQDERTALSNALISDACESEHVDKGEVEVFCDLLSRHLNDVGSEMFGDADEVVGVQQGDDTEAQNTWDQLTNISTRLRIPVPRVAKCHACSVCHQTFGTASRLKSHKCIHSGLKTRKTAERRYVCDICTEAFVISSALTRHRRIHTHDKPHTCDVCQKRFTSRGHLKTHILTHTAERAHKCDVCQKQFTQARSHKAHMLIHSTYWRKATQMWCMSQAV